MNKVYIFLNNKLVSCDTILPLAIELKNKAPSIKINFFVFDIKTYEEIKKNTTLYNLIDKIGKLDFIGWKQTRKYSLINKFLKLLHLYFIILNVLFHKNRVIHFRYLEEFPWNIIYCINKKNTILFESDCWGYEENVAKIFYDFKPNKVKSDYFKNYYSLVYFGTKWPQVIHAKNNEKKLFHISSTRTFDCWRNETKQELTRIIDNKPSWHKSQNKGILFILGWLGHSHMHKKNITGEDLFKETIDLIINNTNFNIILKPHAVTDMGKVKNIINDLYDDRIFIDYNHVSVLSGYFDITLSNYPSLTMADAFISGSTVIEYSDYSKMAKELCKNKSLYNKYVDFYINRKPKNLINLLRKEFKRKINNRYTYNEDTNMLIEYLKN